MKATEVSMHLRIYLCVFKNTNNGPVASVKGKLGDDLAPMDRGNGEEQVRSRSMNQYDHVMI